MRRFIMSDGNYEIVDFGNLRPGDKLIGSDGQITEITNIYEKHKPKKMYEIEMEDGEVIKASGNHLWYCESEFDYAKEYLYREMAEEYFENNVIPDRIEVDQHYPIDVIVTFFGNSVPNALFIQRVCQSLGYSSTTPFMVVKGKFKDAEEETIYNYSYNNLIEFLNKMKESVVNDKGYFYFGEVRTTEEIAKLIGYNIDINIPHKKDII